MSCQGCVGAVKRVLDKLEGAQMHIMLCSGSSWPVTRVATANRQTQNAARRSKTRFILAMLPAGVDSYDINFDAQKVTVKTSLDAQTVFEKVSKTGKKTELVQ